LADLAGQGLYDEVGGVTRLLDDPPRHQGPSQTDGNATENPVEGAEFHGLGDSVTAGALPGEGAGTIGAAFTEEDQGQQQGIGVGSMNEH